MKTLALITIALAWILAALAGAEFFARSVLRPPLQLVAEDEKLGWRFVPNAKTTAGGGTLTTNSLGFRGPEWTKPKPAGVFRVLVLGDSYVAGISHPDNEVSTAILQDKLNADPRVLGKFARAEVLNAGISAWSTDQQVLFYEEIGRHYAPDLVVLVAVPNDIREAFAKSFFRLEKEALVRGDGVPPRIGFRDRVLWSLLNRSAFVQWLGARYDFNDVYAILRRRYRFTFPLGGRECLSHDLFRKSVPPELMDARALFEALLLRLRATVRDSGAEFLVTVIPTKIERLWPFTVDPAFSAGLISSYVGAFAGKNGVPYLDLAGKAWKLGDDMDSLFIDSEYHWSGRGHRFVAEILAERIASTLGARAHPAAVFCPMARRVGTDSAIPGCRRRICAWCRLGSRTTPHSSRRRRRGRLRFCRPVT